MSGWTLKEVAARARRELDYYTEEDPAMAVVNALASILSDLGKFDEGRQFMSKSVPVPLILAKSAQSDDTFLWELIAKLEEHE